MSTSFRDTLSGLLLTLIALGWAAAAEKAPPEKAVFTMREVSAFDKIDVRPGHYLLRGQYAQCSTEPDKEVKAYPKLKSKHPLYGKVKFFLNSPNPVDRKGVEFHFVLDESGEGPPAVEQSAKEKPWEEEMPKERKLAGQMSTQKKPKQPAGTAEKTASTASAAPPRTSPRLEPKRSRYDRLYFDLNRDLDLTNDPVLKPLEYPGRSDCFLLGKGWSG